MQGEVILSRQQQEGLLTLMSFSPEYGKAVVNLVPSNEYEGDYATVAERLHTYWSDEGQPPGAAMIDDLFPEINDKLERKARRFREIIQSLSLLWNTQGFNPRYIISGVQEYRSHHIIQNGLIKGAEMLSKGGIKATAAVREMLGELSRSGVTEMDKGLTLGDYDKMFDWLERRESEFATGIPLLDKRGITPFRGGLMMYVGCMGSGKSWFLINIGRMAAQARKRVLHISLEMSAEEVLKRYYQNLWALSKWEPEVSRPKFKLRDGQIEDIVWEKVKPTFTLHSKNARENLEALLSSKGKMSEAIQVKQFPNQSLTPSMLRGYLDTLGYTPDILVLDYAGAMKTDPRNHRIDSGRNVAELRAIAVERDMAVVSAWQSNRQGAKEAQVKLIHISEDWSVAMTADVVLTYSATDSERNLGLGRLYVAKCRDEEDKWGIVLAQSYAIGQYCFPVSSGYLDEKYWERIKDEAEDEDVEADDAMDEDDE